MLYVKFNGPQNLGQDFRIAFQSPTKGAEEGKPPSQMNRKKGGNRSYNVTKVIIVQTKRV